MQEIIQKIEKQEVEISYIKKTLNELAIQNKKQSDQLQKIGEAIHKQELILEKISNLEERYNDGVKRVHKRMDDEIHHFNEKIFKLEKEINNEVLYINEKIEKLEKNVESCCNRPCVSHNVIEVELNNIKKQQEKFSKIFYWGATLIIGIVIAGIIKSHLS